MKTIFENAYFGKAYKTRDGRKAIYHSYNDIYPDNPYQSHHNLILEEKDGVRDTIWIWCNDYGHIEEHIEGEWLNETDSDIVSEWQEPIDEHNIEVLANTAMWKYSETPDAENIGEYKEGWFDGYKQGWEDKK